MKTLITTTSFSGYGIPQRHIRKDYTKSTCKFGSCFLATKYRWCAIGNSNVFATTSLLVEKLGLKEGTTTSFQSVGTLSQ
jgi:hypothetical protein